MTRPIDRIASVATTDTETTRSTRETPTAGTVGTRVGCIAVVASLLLPLPASRGQTDLAAGFANPPHGAKPHTWWHWMNGNITKEGITADLEAMQQIGLGGAQIFNVSESIPAGPIKYNSPEWRALVKFAAEEAGRLGLELCFHNCAGWSSSGGPWIKPEQAMQMVVFSEKRVTGPAAFADVLPQPETRHDSYHDIAVLAFPTPKDDATRIDSIKFKAGYESRYGQQPDLTEYSSEVVIQREQIVDLTRQLAAGGRLTWDVPAGAWTILRFGYTPTGAVCAPAPESGRGLECDKLSCAGLDAHWTAGIAPLLEELGPLAGKVLNNSLIDSYEMGPQNWTAEFRAAFMQLRGYDPVPLLPVMTGRVVDSGEISERFLWDLRRTIADLFAQNYYDYFAELCHRVGLLASIEPYDGPFECLRVGKGADVTMGEFWVGGGESSSCKLAASVAHTYGKRLVGAESFTAAPSRGRWQNYPYSLKTVGDLMYTTGVNRYIIHRYAHQPWQDVLPGMTMGQWGTHFERTTTWWQPGAAWVRYLHRCQYLLQAGRFVADVCYFMGDAAPQTAVHDPELKSRGYDYDACNPDVLLTRMTVQDGRVTLPDGLSYRVLVLPDTPFMTPPVAQKLRALVQAGAVVIGPRPTRSPSLAHMGVGDAMVKKVGAELWGDCDGRTVRAHVFGKGKVIWGRTVEEVLDGLGVKPDVSFVGGPFKPAIAWIHRVVDGTDIYFVSNQTPRAADVECTFRVSGKVPELWYADTGCTEPAAVWREDNGRTTVPIRFDPAGSVFVVFRQKAAGDHLVSAQGPQTAADVTGPKIEIRKAVYEAVDGAGGADVTEKVAALVAAGEYVIGANNGVFGDPTPNHVKQLRLEYVHDGQPRSRTVPENGSIELAELPRTAAWPAFTISPAGAGKFELRGFEAGMYRLQSAAGKLTELEIRDIDKPLELSGPWTLRFPPNWGAPAAITLEKLMSWTEHADAGVRYFSGTGEYEKKFDVPADLLKADQAIYLDLGEVKSLAEVTLNGEDLAVWWKPPFAADVTSLLKPGQNMLKVRVTNLWVNRLIGDEQYPDDCEWNGKPLKRWPDWFVQGEPRPVQERLTFTTWKHWTKDDTPLESGLMGPVRLVPAKRVRLDWP
jgi:hypothetical protein